MSVLRYLTTTPELNFLRTIANFSLNRSVFVETYSRDLNWDEPKIEDSRFISEISNVTREEKSFGMITSNGEIFHTRFRKVEFETPYFFIGNLVVASFEKPGISADEVKKVNKAFTEKLIPFVAQWNVLYRDILCTYFVLFIVATLGSALLVRFGELKVVAAMVMRFLFIISLVFLKITSFRLIQLYHFREKYEEISHVGHWVACLWNAVRLDPTLFQKYPFLKQTLFLINHESGC